MIVICALIVGWRVCLFTDIGPNVDICREMARSLLAFVYLFVLLLFVGSFLLLYECWLLGTVVLIFLHTLT